jgi:hypothetical protein
MNNVEPKGAVRIDHYVVGTNDMVAWVDWAVNAIGLTRRPIIGLTTAARKRNIKITSFLWWEGGSCRIGAFLQPEIYPPAKELGKELPRCGYYIRPADIDRHLSRLDRHKIAHSDAIRTAADGDEGTVIYYADPDGNQYEFWAPCICPKRHEIAPKARRPHQPCAWLPRARANRDLFCKYCTSNRARFEHRRGHPGAAPACRRPHRVQLIDKVDERVAAMAPVGHAHCLTVRTTSFCRAIGI